MNAPIERRVVMNNYDNHIVISELDTSNYIDHVPAMIYHARMTQKEELVLVKERKQFEVPSVLYKPHPRYRDAICAEYDREGPAMGVLLEGSKGSGKSLLAEDIANWALKQDIPVVSVDVKLPVQMLRMIYSAIGPHVLLIDEFDKLYMTNEDNEDADAEKLLNFFSDSSNRGLFSILTMNKSSPALYADRPQRFNFRIMFRQGVAEETVNEIIDIYKPTQKLASIIRSSLATNGNSWNIDCLKRVCREAALLGSVEDLIRNMEILNVPSLSVSVPAVLAVDLNSCVAPGGLTYDIDSDIITITLNDGTVENIEWKSADQVVLGNGEVASITTTLRTLHTPNTYTTCCYIHRRHFLNDKEGAHQDEDSGDFMTAFAVSRNPSLRRHHGLGGRDLSLARRSVE